MFMVFISPHFSVFVSYSPLYFSAINTCCIFHEFFLEDLAPPSPKSWLSFFPFPVIYNSSLSLPLFFPSPANRTILHPLFRLFLFFLFTWFCVQFVSPPRVNLESFHPRLCCSTFAFFFPLRPPVFYPLMPFAPVFPTSTTCGLVRYPSILVVFAFCIRDEMFLPRAHVPPGSSYFLFFFTS